MQAIVNSGSVSILPGQGSHRLGTLVQSNAICWLEQELVNIKKNSLVKTLSFT